MASLKIDKKLKKIQPLTFTPEAVQLMQEKAD